MLDTILSMTAIHAITWKIWVMWWIIGFMFYLAVNHKFMPMLLVPIAFGALLANLPTHGIINTPQGVAPGGLFYYISKGIELNIYVPIIFMGVGAIMDFSPLIANPRTLLLGGAAQLGVLVTFLGCHLSGFFSPSEAAAIGIIGGADGPTSVFLASKLAPQLIGPIVVAAYAYMALVPYIQPPIMRFLTSVEERKIIMKPLRRVSKLERMMFSCIIMGLCIILIPKCSSLISMLMLGNILKESNVVERLTKASQNEIMSIVTIFLGASLGLTMSGETFLNVHTLIIMVMGVVAFGMSTAGGVLMAKMMNVLSPNNPLNPLIGAAGVSAMPMAARVAHMEGQKADPKNYLLMHAMGANVAGVIGTIVVAGYFMSYFS